MWLFVSIWNCVMLIHSSGWSSSTYSAAVTLHPSPSPPTASDNTDNFLSLSFCLFWTFHPIFACYYFLLLLLLFYICYLWGWTHTKAWVQRSEDCLPEFVLSSHYVGSADWTQVTSLVASILTHWVISLAPFYYAIVSFLTVLDLQSWAKFM